eukprot:CAMPEP_0173423872 /NCGR_PEP_ID=MMETSP1357-20121228/3991_1 /TAXON_ID=77926 /ORGANISM="Hemiselmis rufescens, Strain PCC563" /LENGTH=435 /DNA_ID=CAMNT_0014387029 /DNA_START=71 /DNA_END=1374 /DNA_ORIENTATION=+
MPFSISAEEREKLVIGLQYDPNESLKNLFKWRGSIFSFVFWKLQAWFLVVVHTTLWGMYHYHKCEDSDGRLIDGCVTTRDYLNKHLYPPSLRDLAPLVGAFMFGMIFYLQSSYSVYREFYFNGHQISGSIKNATLIVRAAVTRPQDRWDVVRYLLVSQRVMYWEALSRTARWKRLPEDHPENPGSLKEFLERECHSTQLISRKEIILCIAWKGSFHQLMCSWAIQKLREVLRGEMGESKLSESDAANTIQRFMEICTNLRDFTSKLHQMLLIPVPFPYYHLIESMSFAVLLVVAFAFINLNGNLRPPDDTILSPQSHISVFVYPMMVFVTLGITEMANKMQDPLGTDEVDFNVNAYLTDTYVLSLAQCFQPGDLPVNDPEVCTPALTMLGSTTNLWNHSPIVGRNVGGIVGRAGSAKVVDKGGAGGGKDATPPPP